MLFITNPRLRKLEAFMQEIPHFPPKGAQVDLDSLEDEILLFEIENVIINVKPPNENLNIRKDNIMKFRNEKHRSTFLNEAEKQSLKNYKIIAALYLLTADEKLWDTAKGSVGKDDIAFDDIHLKNGSEKSHARCGTGEKAEIVSKPYLSLSLPKIEGLEMMFSASRSRKISIVAIIQSLAQFEKTYGKEGAEIIVDNCQCTLFGSFAPNSKTAEVMSKNLGTQTVLSGSISKTAGKDGTNRTLQMIERPLMTVDELKSMPKGHFVVMKTGCYPMKTRLKLFFKWGIKFEETYAVNEQAERKVQYADRTELETDILKKYTHVAVPVELNDYDKAISKKCSPKTRKKSVNQK